MPFVIVGNENGAPIEIHYEDHGSGRPVLLIHGYPLDGNSWERQERELLLNGYRVITYDRRGFGRSSQPSFGYDYDSFAGDLHVLIEHLDLRDLVLVGFRWAPWRSCATSGPMGRECGRPRSSARSHRSCSRQTITPKAWMARCSLTSRLQSLPTGMPFSRDSSTTSTTSMYSAATGSVIGPGTRASMWRSVLRRTTYACVDTWLTDFRTDLPKIDVPVLVLHGTENRILPFEVTAARLPALIDDCTLIPIEDGPHNIAWTFPDEANEACFRSSQQMDSSSPISDAFGREGIQVTVSGSTPVLRSPSEDSALSWNDASKRRVRLSEVALTLPITAHQLPVTAQAEGDEYGPTSQIGSIPLSPRSVH
jgi:non-heme chloroperoxidase